MPDLLLPDIVGRFQQGQAFGDQRREQQAAIERRSRLSELAAQAYGASPEARQGLLQQAVGVDPQAGLALSGQLGDEDKRREQLLLNNARLIDSAPPEMKDAIFQRVRPQIESYLPNLPFNYNEQVGQGIKAFIQSRTQAGGTPAGFQELHMKALAAGYQPGTPGYQQAMRVGVGLEGRAPTGGFGFQKVIGADGRERLGRQNPRTGMFEIYDEQTGDFVPMGRGGALSGGQPPPAQSPTLSPPMSSLNPSQDFSKLTAMFGIQPSSTLRSKAKNDEVDGVTNSYHLTGQAADYPVPSQQKPAFIAQARAMGYEAIDEGDHIHIEPPPNRGTGGRAAVLGAGRSPEEQAALTTQAQEQAKLGLLPQRAAIETQAEIDKERALQGVRPTKAQEAVDTQYGKDYVEFISGGAADANKALTELSGVIDELESGANLTGPVIGALPNAVKVRTNPQAMAAQETVESTVQRSLRVILGAQFTAEEGERLIARAYNPNLPEEVNARRVKLLFQQLQEGFANKAAAARYYEQNGTLRGFTGKLPSWGDFDVNSPKTNNVPRETQDFGGFRVLED